MEAKARENSFLADQVMKSDEERKAKLHKPDVAPSSGELSGCTPPRGGAPGTSPDTSMQDPSHVAVMPSSAAGSKRKSEVDNSERFREAMQTREDSAHSAGSVAAAAASSHVPDLGMKFNCLVRECPTNGDVPPTVDELSVSPLPDEQRITGDFFADDVDE